MPQTRKQETIFTLIMAFFMVSIMMTYNTAIETNTYSIKIVQDTLEKVWPLYMFAFIVENFLIGRFVQWLFLSIITDQTAYVLKLFIRALLTVCFMAPTMCFVGTLYGHGITNRLLPTWWHSLLLNFPMALCVQLFIAGPIVRSVFRRIKQCL